LEFIILNFIVLFGGSYGVSTLLLRRSAQKLSGKGHRRGIAVSVQRW